MIKGSKRVIAALLAGAMLISSALTVFADTASPTTVENPSGNCEITITDDAVAVTEVKNEKTVHVAKHVAGTDEIVDTIETGAFSDADKTTTVVVPSSITTIKKGAFTGATKLKRLHLNSKKAGTKLKVEKGAFKGVNTKNVTITVNKKTSAKQLKKLKAKLKAAGFKGTVKRGKKP